MKGDDLGRFIDKQQKQAAFKYSRYSPLRLCDRELAVWYTDVPPFQLVEM